MTITPDVESQLGSDVYALLERMVMQLNARRPVNMVRAHYYSSQNAYRDLGISTPPHMRNLEVALGWPAKAVDALSRRVKHDGFVLPGGDIADWGIDEIWADNNMALEAKQAHTSALIHSPTFIATTLGDVRAGEPEVMLSTFDAMNATGLWSPLNRSLRSWLGVIRTHDDGRFSRLVMLTPDMAYGITDLGNSWDVRAIRHGLGRVPVEVLRYRPRTDQPFGTSRITRPIMRLTDSALRTVVRSEVGAEFFSAPQRYLLGADEEAFVGPNGEQKSTWDMVVGRILAVERDEEGEVPTVGQFPQVSMQPHTEHLRMWATLFAAEARLPVNALGIVLDNPSSAEAIYAAHMELIEEAEDACEGFTSAWVRSMMTAVQLRERLREVPPELRRLGARWRDPAQLSRAAATDATMKQVEAGVLPAESDVTLEALGYDDTTIQRIQADRRRASGRATLQALRESTGRRAAAAPEVPNVVGG